MREALIILGVIAVLLALTAYRYRRQIGAFYQFWQVLKQARVQGKRNAKEMNQPAETALGPLVNCVKCGTWVPESKSIKLGPRIYYCSTDCVEKTAKAA